MLGVGDGFGCVVLGGEVDLEVGLWLLGARVGVGVGCAC